MKISCNIAAFVVLALVVSVIGKPTTVKDEEIEDKLPSTTELVDKLNEDAVKDGQPNSTTEPSDLDEDRCRSMIGRFVDGKFEGLEVHYDLMKVLEEHGGSPGRVNIKWTGRGDAPLENPRERPLPDADEKYWIYNYRNSDNQTYLRTEHALARFSGVPNKAFLEYRGMIIWTPEDFCGKARRANYIYDDTGFSFEVTREYCTINQLTYSCLLPANCRTASESGDLSSAECGGNEESNPLLFGGSE